MRGARPRGSPGQGYTASSIGCARGMIADCEGSGTFTDQAMECCDGQRDDTAHRHEAEPLFPTAQHNRGNRPGDQARRHGCLGREAAGRHKGCH